MLIYLFRMSYICRISQNTAELGGSISAWRDSESVGRAGRESVFLSPMWSFHIFVLVAWGGGHGGESSALFVYDYLSSGCRVSLPVQSFRE